MSDKLPYIKIYVGDFYSSVLPGLPHEAQLLWLRLLFQMHTSERRGYLQMNGLPIPPQLAATRAGYALELYNTLLCQLLPCVFQVNEDGVIYSQQMVDEEKKRLASKKRVGEHRRRKSVTSLKRHCNACVTPLSVYVYECECVCLDCKGVNESEKAPKLNIPIPEDLKQAMGSIFSWLSYKSERRESYKPRGLEALFSRIREIPPDKRAEAILNAMSNNWAGIHYRDFGGHKNAKKLGFADFDAKKRAEYGKGWDATGAEAGADLPEVQD